MTIICTKCGEHKTEADFYKRYGKLMQGCKECRKKADRKRIEIDEYADNAERIEKLKSIQRSRRPRAVYNWIRDREITIEEFKVICRNVDISV